MKTGDLVLVHDCPNTPGDILGIITGVDHDANDFSGDLDADLYRVFITEQKVIRWFTNRNLTMLSSKGKDDYLR
jgi:hypothetical protein